MLVLTRKSEEKIVIGKGKNRIVITILKIQGDKVSVGIEADKETPIFRDELLREVERTNQGELLHRKSVPAQEVARALQAKIQQNETVETEVEAR